LGAVWLQPQPGRYALLTPPALAAAVPQAVAEALLLRALEFARESSVNLVQALLPADAEGPVKFLLQHDFSELAELLYLVALSHGFPSAEPRGAWRCRKIDSGDLPRLTALVECTYEGSLDCPGLAGRRSAADALAGYAAVGCSGLDHWRFVEEAGQAVGCLLLADHPGDGPRELVYLGLLPQVRGRGWGEQLSRFAQWTCRAAGKELLVLAVDAANAPAVAAYARAGFTRWETRRVLVRNLDSRSPTSASPRAM
jgi:ribosomal protein S18 acetylase RimI-like enzyme